MGRVLEDNDRQFEMWKDCEDYRVLDDLRISEENPWVQKFWELTGAWVSYAAGRYPLSALADLRGNTEFAFDLYDRPEDVARGMER